MFKDRRNKVARRMIEGNEDSSNGFRIYVATRTIIKENVMFRDKRMSRSMGGNGITINTRMPTTAAAKKMSLFFVNNGIWFKFTVWFVICKVYELKC